MTTTLIRYDAACRALAAAKTVDEVMKIRNTAEAVRAYARQAKNRTLEIDAAEIRMRAERRVGEFLLLQKQTVGMARPAIGSKVIGNKRVPMKDTRPTLAELNVDKKLSARAQQLAKSGDFDSWLARWRARVASETERVTTNLLREVDRDRLRDERVAPALPAGLFRLLLADPPWQYEHVATASRAIENQYPTMTLDAICALQVPAADDAVLFLWATPPKLAEAVRVVASWGFDYRTCAIWDKEKIGMGYYFRQQHELLLVAARGAFPVPEPSLRPSSILRARRTKHSVKPVEAYEMLEAMYPALTKLDRLELFGRAARPGWTLWGNELVAVNA